MHLRPYLIALTCTVILFAHQATAQKFYKTPSGQKYHLGSCHMVNNVSEEVSIERIIELGLGPCKICNPQVVSKQSLSSNTPRGKTTTVQCKGLTKAGTRCRHMTSLGNGYCFQHNPDK